MKNSFVLAVFLACTVVFSYAGHRNTAGNDAETDSIKRQLYMYEKLDLITETAIPLLNEIGLSTELPKLTAPTVEGKLKQLLTAVPLDYNAQVQSYIDRYSTDRYRSYLSRMMGLSTYYFPIYEQVFKETGLPAEIKYLSIIESALDPHAVSRVGATGLWQFMYATAKMYELRMDRHMDERKDPVLASYAASRYLLEGYERFGDWLLAIAAYNCGPGNVQKAIQRSGKENPDFWTISPFLPRETRNYVPAFIAMTYMLEYHEEHGIFPEGEVPQVGETQLISVQNPVPFSTLAAAIGTDESLLKFLNPAYKQDFVNGSVETPKRLILPQVSPANYGELYAVLNETDHSISNEALLAASQPATVTYTVKRGDTLSGIAKKHKGATVNGIKTANGLKSNQIKPGMKLQIF
ncbi:MAG TPA: transglycosylase SLT domain-containing protein [Sphingobacteriaceae bacterium]|nr:transglycosylase SLT domain-containing protein [Sphingobacteriaceae bacterium]